MLSSGKHSGILVGWQDAKQSKTLKAPVYLITYKREEGGQSQALVAGQQLGEEESLHGRGSPSISCWGFLHSSYVVPYLVW